MKVVMFHSQQALSGSCCDAEAPMKRTPSQRALLFSSMSLTIQVVPSAHTSLSMMTCMQGKAVRHLTGMSREEPARFADFVIPAAGPRQQDMRQGHIIVGLQTQEATSIIKYSCSKRVIPIPTSYLTARRLVPLHHKNCCSIIHQMRVRRAPAAST